MRHFTIRFGAMIIACTTWCTAQQVDLRTAVPATDAIAQQQQHVPDIVLIDKQPELKKSVEPVYPPEALAKNLGGKVWLKILIDTTGHAADVQVLKSENGIFNDAAMAAARQCLFTPARKDGKPVPVWITMPYLFKLAEKNGDGPSDKTQGETGPVGELMQKVDLVFTGDPAARACIGNEAYLVDGGRFVSLNEALFGKEKGKCFAGERARKRSFTKVVFADDKRSATLVFKTENAKKKDQHWHTITWVKDGEGEWKITHWHASR